MIHGILSGLQTDPYLLATHSLYIYSALFVKDVEPKYNYHDRFFSLLNLDFQRFLEQDDIRTILLEASPRTGKTEFLINVVLGSIIAKEQNKNILLVAGNKKLQKRLRRLIQRLCESEFFYKITGGFVSITSANEGEIRFNNGIHIDFMTTGSASPTGNGYHYIFLIDFLLPSILRSEAKFSTALSQLSDILTRTQDDPATKVIIDNQRLGVYDLSAVMAERYTEQGEPFHRITLPYYFTEDRRVISFDGSATFHFKEGEYLTSRFNDRSKRGIIAKHGLDVFETQYQQNPKPAGSEVFNVKHFMYYKPLDLQQKFVDLFITTDFAFEKKKYNDFSVFCCWGITDTEHLYLLDMVRVKERGIVVEQLLNSFIQKWIHGFKNGGSGLTKVLSENVASMKIINQDFRARYGGLWLELARTKDKYSRACEIFGFFESGNVWLPSVNVLIDGVKDVKNDVVEPFLYECNRFRQNANEYEHDDIVDCFIDACVYTIQRKANRNYDFRVGFGRV